MLRDDVAALTDVAAEDLEAIWAQIDRGADAVEALSDVLAALVVTYGTAAATVAADWYDDHRAERGVGGRFTAIPVEVGESGSAALARWGVGPLFRDTPDLESAKVLVAGGLQRRIANAARETVRVSTLADPQATGWQRVGVGSCAFCRMLIARGAVYRESTADFASHDHCQCYAVPAFGGQPVPVRPYTPSTRDISDADRARVRAYLRTHDAG